MDLINKVLVSENYVFIALVFVGVFILWFLPAMLALIFNRKQFKLILLACIPAGLSFIAWGGVLVWAISGRAVAKYTSKVDTENSKTP
ncbi:superinfection immunity protein [Colwellia sp. Arc7-635]|uniref:superinfection immunity protein n=1 Tax=Colwellia sp. Arc7-635 TaxID=2497879 RepID=UPI000F850303|nr:superinfection immunity protein [Colwellia sp. Arc7-635]AZQ85072.1 superinfection immunity protein [Colwellia sp. Arc7-635]